MDEIDISNRASLQGEPIADFGLAIGECGSHLLTFASMPWAGHGWGAKQSQCLGGLQVSAVRDYSQWAV
jgi:hypothetical protein